MTLKHKTLDYFLKYYPKKTTKEKITSNTYEGYVGGIASIYFGIYKEWDGNDNCWIFEAEIQWSNDGRNRRIEYFPCTWEGFISACEWLDNQRIKVAETYAESLL